MSVRNSVIAPPMVTPISLEEAKDHLNIDDGDHDNYISALIAVATQAVDAPSWLGRALVTQTLEIAFDGEDVPCGRVPLPYRPVQSIASVTYEDSAGDVQTLDESAYSLSLDAVRFTGTAPWQSGCGPVRIQYVAGYGDAAADVPAPIKHALLLLISHYYETREAVSLGTSNPPVEIPLAFKDLLSPYRIPV